MEKSFLLPMSRNFYILAGAFLLFSLISLGMSWTHSAQAQGLPGDTAAWRILALIFFVVSAFVCMIGTVTHMFEQASRRHEERQWREGKRTQPPKP